MSNQSEIEKLKRVIHQSRNVIKALRVFDTYCARPATPTREAKLRFLREDLDREKETLRQIVNDL